MTDEQGRDPLLTTKHGRLSGATIRETVYKATRPCYYGNDCPRDRDPDECDGTEYGPYSRCPSGVCPRSVRRGSITRHLSEDVPERVVSDLTNPVERTQSRPWGLFGAEGGASGRTLPFSDGETEQLTRRGPTRSRGATPSRSRCPASAGTAIRPSGAPSPSGGTSREYITPDEAREAYAVAVSVEDGVSVDEAETARLRDERR